MHTPHVTRRDRPGPQAAALEAEGDALGVAPLLRARLSSKLAKDQLLQLCAAWGYAHHAWRRKGDGERKRKQRPKALGAPSTAGGGSSAAAVSVAASNPPWRVARGVDSVLLLSFDAASLAQFVAGALGSAAGASFACLHGVRVKAAVEAHRTLHCTGDAISAYDMVAVTCGLLITRMEGLRDAQAEWSCAATARADADARHAAAAAWQALPLLGDAAPVHEALALLRAAFVFGRRLYDDTLTTMEGAALLSRGRAMVRLAYDEYMAGITAGMLFVTQAEAALSAARLDAELGEYTCMCDAISAECVRFVAEVQAVVLARAAWSRRVLEPGYCVDTPFCLPCGVKLIESFCTSLIGAADGSADGISAA
jgi:hypothetical protein